MSGKIALDTDVSIKFLNGYTNIDAVLLKYSEICLPAIVVGELVFGALNFEACGAESGKTSKTDP